MSTHAALQAAHTETLSPEECTALLATQRFGRLAVAAEGYPLVFPVNYGMDGPVVVIRTRPGTKLTAALGGNVVLEVDEVNPYRGTGWSVLVRGRVEELSGAHGEDVVRRTLEVDVVPWEAGPHEHWLRLVPHDVTGRRLVAGALPQPGEDAGYL
jgi:nitroimidazol reductase NimA-like FMN-containing flavoprotein (pyridoxamine 5'-phosphate oxidase superfamily)